MHTLRAPPPRSIVPAPQSFDIEAPRSRDCRDFTADLARHFVVARCVAALNLDIDRHGQAEVQNLIGDVGGLEEKGFVREFGAQVFP